MSGMNSDQLHRSTLRIYGNLMEQFNPGLQKLVSLGNSYVQAYQALSVTSEAYFSALAHMGEQALHSVSSRSLGDVIIQLSESQRRLAADLEGVFRWFHGEVLQEMDHNVKLDREYLSNSRRQYELELRTRVPGLDRQLRRGGAYRDTQDGSEALQYLRQSQRAALREEERRYRFLAEKHCGLAQSLLYLLNKTGGVLQQQAERWREQVNETRGAPRAHTPVLPHEEKPVPRGSFLQAVPREEDRHWAAREGQPPERAPSRGPSPGPRSRSSSVGEALGMGMGMGTGVGGQQQVRALVPHPTSSNPTLLAFAQGDTLTLLRPEPQNGWLYGRAQNSTRQGWFPAAYVGPITEPPPQPVPSNRTLRNNHSTGDLLSQSDVALVNQRTGAPPPAPPLPRPSTTPTLPRKAEMETDTRKKSTDHGSRPDLFPRGTNPFATVKLRPTATNDRSGPRI
ncbi:BAR/IMD domain-containing adapter protein 2-like 2 isoform X2 [Amia ocellicauda]|uniref:BAR/IMD domain-containing adapter protein 2-like 2 isoform X2 n=1 Tax=Amia ocellicauda TaxID=2972642 RepID=UPI003463B588